MASREVTAPLLSSIGWSSSKPGINDCTLQNVHMTWTTYVYMAERGVAATNRMGPNGTIGPMNDEATDLRYIASTELRQYQKRIDELIDAAEEERITPRASSLKIFVEFLNRSDFRVKKGALFLLDDGSFGLVWRDEKLRLELDFYSADRIQYVILDRRSEQPKGKSGWVTLATIDRVSRKDGIDSLLKV